MKTISIAIIGAVILTEATSFGQSTITFQTSLDGAHAVPPNSSTRIAAGQFTFQASSLFSGSLGTTDYLDITSVSLFRASGASDVGAKLYDFTPGLIVAPGPNGEPGGRLFDFSSTLTTSEADDLNAGLWFVTVITPGFPNGEIRGQMSVVPEPSTIAMVITGGAFLASQVRRRSAQKAPA